MQDCLLQLFVGVRGKRGADRWEEGYKCGPYSMKRCIAIKSGAGDKHGRKERQLNDLEGSRDGHMRLGSCL